jgi:hypothetical protein
MQQIVPLARALGVNETYARELTEFFWARMYPLDADAYRSSECRPGRKLDLQRHSSAWP